jgi:hypothetical protein
MILHIATPILNPMILAVKDWTNFSLVLKQTTSAGVHGVATLLLPL